MGNLRGLNPVPTAQLLDNLNGEDKAAPSKTSETANDPLPFRSQV